MSIHFLRRNNIKEIFKIHLMCQKKLSTLSKYDNRNSQISTNGKTTKSACFLYCIKRSFIGFVPDKKDGYKTQKDGPIKENVIIGLKQLKKELNLWTEEMKETLRGDPLLICPPGSFINIRFDYFNININLSLGEIDTVYEFGKKEDIDKFIVTSDSDHNEGYSHCSLVLNQSGYGQFSGVLDSTVPKQGNLSRAGYCNITSLRVKVCNSYRRQIIQQNKKFERRKKQIIKNSSCTPLTIFNLEVL